MEGMPLFLNWWQCQNIPHISRYLDMSGSASYFHQALNTIESENADKLIGRCWYHQITLYCARVHSIDVPLIQCTVDVPLLVGSAELYALQSSRYEHQ